MDRGSIFFGPAQGRRPQNRFDAPNQEYRVLYAAQHLEGAFVETVLRRPVGRILRRQVVEERGWSIVRPSRALTLAKLFDDGLQFHQIDAGEISTDDYAPSRALALALHTDFPDLDGLAYKSRYNNGEICYAIFDRVTPQEFDPEPVSPFADHKNRVDDMMDLYGAVFDTSPPIPPM
ncbi:RES family NAD+ phosphorylase [Rhizobium laguerreae]|uniref:RES family NAD+ phosphorylase n=1 Tax=Rhizobium laguerreae TaxID=1076926 RepID=A0A7Y2R8Y3_9HYPH|nr:RES family NAD+ phosphorylase [Rhizobium laguerreae]